VAIGNQRVAAMIAARTISGILSSVSVGVINGGARQIVSPIGGSALPARMRGSSPRASASRVKRAPSPSAR